MLLARQPGKIVPPLRPTTRQRRVLVADDDPDMRRLVGGALRRDGFHVDEFRDGPTLLEHLGSSMLHHRRSERPALLVSDIRMPGFSGLEILAGLRLAEWDLPVVLISAYDDDEARSLAAAGAATAVVHKPFDVEALRALVRRLAAAPPRPSRRCASCRLGLVMPQRNFGGPAFCAECRESARPYDPTDPYDEIGGSD